METEQKQLNDTLADLEEIAMIMQMRSTYRITPFILVDVKTPEKEKKN